MRATVFIVLLLGGNSAIGQPLVDDRPARQHEAPEFQSAPPPRGFQTRITRASIRDHLRDYRVRPLQDGVVVQRRFTIGK